MAIRQTRTRTLERSEKSGISDVLARRRGTVRAAVEGRVQKAKEAPEQVVTLNQDDYDDILTEAVNAARNDVRTRRPGQHIHVSDLLSKCQRKIALIERAGLPHRVTRLSLMDALTFRMGEALHDVVKERAALGKPDAVWGKWKCVCGHLHHDEPCTFAEVDLADVCEHCGTPTTEYVEVSMFWDELMLVGNPDLIFYLRMLDAFHVTELKSIAHAQWDVLTRPLPEHVIQVLFYWYIMRALGYRLTDRVTLFYGTKGYLFKGSPFKEFSIKVEPELHRLDDYLQEARELHASRNGGPLPARTACASENSPDARKCEVCQSCFGDENAETKTITLADLFANVKDTGSGHRSQPNVQRVRLPRGR